MSVNYLLLRPTFSKPSVKPTRVHTFILQMTKLSNLSTRFIVLILKDPILKKMTNVYIFRGAHLINLNAFHLYLFSFDLNFKLN